MTTRTRPVTRSTATAVYTRSTRTIPRTSTSVSTTKAPSLNTLTEGQKISKSEYRQNKDIVFPYSIATSSVTGIIVQLLIFSVIGIIVLLIH